MEKRKLGNQGLEVSALGLGCMGLTWAYGQTNETESLKVLHRAWELGVDFYDTAEIYGPYNNEELLAKFIKDKPRQQIKIATKFGFEINNNAMGDLNSKPKHIRKALDGSLKRLGTDYVDLYYQHRLDPNTPIEDTVGELSKLVDEGKVKYIGLSEVGSAIIQRAHKVHPLTAIQSEYSLWERDVEKTILPLLRELQIGFVPYSPLGRGFLTGKITSTNDLEAGDWRREHFPRLQDENIEHNTKLVDTIKQIATQNKVTPAQIALAWLLKQGKDIVPIPGTKKLKYLEENLKSLEVNLSASAWKPLEEMLANFKPAGDRYSADRLKLTDQSN